MPARDPLIAPPDSVPKRDPSVLALADCWRSFVGRRTPPLLARGIVAAIALRALGQYDWRDARDPAAYEWSQFLIHTPYRPRGRYYRSISRHRLHRYKNEHYWLRVTTTLADQLLGTGPERSDVSRY